MINEKEFNSKKKIKYIFKEIKDSKNLIIVFSGYSNNPKVKAPYNYMKTLKDIKVNQLFISDSYGYDGRGCWYIGENGNADVEESVIELINFIINKLNIDKKDVILAGTSKGGFASLYYGIKYKFGNVITGGPQVYISKYLEKINNKNILNCIISGENDKNRLNSLIDDLLIEDDTNIFIICGIKDTHLNDHVLPFINKNTNKSNIYLDIVYGGHSNLGEIYKRKFPLLVNSIIREEEIKKIDLETEKKLEHKFNIQLIKDRITRDNITINLEGNKISTTIDILNIHYKYACYLYTDDGVKKYGYTENPYFEFDMCYSSKYKVKWFIKDELNNIISIDISFKIKLDICN